MTDDRPKILLVQADQLKPQVLSGYPFQPLLCISLAALARKDLPVAPWRDLDKPDVRVAVPQAGSMDELRTRMIPNADIQRFPDNGTSLAAFQSGRVDAVSHFHPPRLAARKKFGGGKIVIPPRPSARLRRPPSAGRPTRRCTSAGRIGIHRSDWRSAVRHRAQRVVPGLRGSDCASPILQLFAVLVGAPCW